MRQRTIRDVLALPQTADEELAADRHIRLEAAAIRAGWPADEYLRRYCGPTAGQWFPPMIPFVGTLDDDGDGTPADDGGP